MIFEKDTYNLVLNNHTLHGNFTGCRTIDFIGDITIIYKLLGNNTAFFAENGIQSKLYSKYFFYYLHRGIFVRPPLNSAKVRESVRYSAVHSRPVSPLHTLTA